MNELLAALASESTLLTALRCFKSIRAVNDGLRKGVLPSFDAHLSLASNTHR